MKTPNKICQGLMCIGLFASLNLIQADQSYNNCGPVYGLPTCGSYNVGLKASYLYWNVQQDFLGFGTENVIVGPNIPTIPNHIWDSGFRLEATSSDNYGPIGYHAEWTYFKTSTNVSTIGNTINSPIPPIAALAAPVGLRNSWKVNINEFAFDLDYCFCLNPCISFRPYLGIYGAIVNQKANVLLDLSAIPPGLSQTSIHRKNDFWGVGPRVGIGGTWNFIQQFNLVFDTNFALLLGKTKSQYNTQFPPEIAVLIPNFIFDSDKSIWSTRPMASAFLGLNWDGCVCRSLFSLSVGYEIQYWWNQWRATDSVIDQFLVGGNRNGDLALNGLVVSVGLSF